MLHKAATLMHWSGSFAVQLYRLCFLGLSHSNFVLILVCPEWCAYIQTFMRGSAISNILCCATELRLFSVFWHVMIKWRWFLIWPADDNSIISVMVEIFVQPLVGALWLIVFHIQAVMDSPDHCAWQLGLHVASCQNSSQGKFFNAFSTHICKPYLPSFTLES